VLVDEFAPLVFVNGADARSAQMLTLAHELAHVAFGSSAAFDLRQMQPASDSIEQACNAVAAEFLVPEDLLRRCGRRRWLRLGCPRVQSERNRGGQAVARSSIDHAR